MTISAKLDRIREELEGCKTLAFADLTTKMILCASAPQPPNQEYLDALCSTAADMLDGEVAAQMAPVMSSNGDDLVRRAIIIQPHEIVVFVRSPLAPEDALCGLCSPNVDLPLLAEKLSTEIDHLAKDA